jgi:hypothetical protein
MEITDMNKIQKYVRRFIKSHGDREKPKGHEVLTDKQRSLYNTISVLVKDKKIKFISVKDIKDEYQKRKISLNSWPTDFCYNLVNIGPDYETKYLIRDEKGEFHFVDIHWIAGNSIPIYWIPKGKGVPFNLKDKMFKVGTYCEGKYIWNFSELNEILNQ